MNVYIRVVFVLTHYLDDSLFIVFSFSHTHNTHSHNTHTYTTHTRTNSSSQFFSLLFYLSVSHFIPHSFLIVLRRLQFYLFPSTLFPRTLKLNQTVAFLQCRHGLRFNKIKYNKNNQRTGYFIVPEESRREKTGGCSGGEVGEREVRRK